MILDLVPPLTRSYFSGGIPATLSYGQAAIFLCLGLQQVDVTAVEKALNLPSNQILALFNKVGAMNDVYRTMSCWIAGEERLWQQASSHVHAGCTQAASATSGSQGS